jgi:hypothetical protein
MAEMRDDLKGRQLTFTEIAKLVGENWQNLSASEKEPFESQAQVAKDRYNRDLGEYKKTSEFRKYSEYLQDFKEKHSVPKIGTVIAPPPSSHALRTTAANRLAMNR